MGMEYYAKVFRKKKDQKIQIENLDLEEIFGNDDVLSSDDEIYIGRNLHHVEFLKKILVCEELPLESTIELIYGLLKKKIFINDDPSREKCAFLLSRLVKFMAFDRPKNIVIEISGK